MAYKENYPPSLGAGASSGNLPPMLSPNKNPALLRQRDHSACRSPDTQLKVRKTRENLRQSIYADVLPPCLHTNASDAGREYDTCVDTVAKDRPNEDIAHHGTSSPLRYTVPAQGSSKPQRQKSISRGMLSKVKQGIANKSKATCSIRASETGSNLIRRLSGKRKQSYEIEPRTQSYGATRESSENDLHSEFGRDQRSLTASSASTMDILGDYLGDETPLSSSSNGFLDLGAGADDKVTVRNLNSVTSSPPSSPSPQPTPRPLRREVRSALPVAPSALAVRSPCVSLRVSMDCSTIDVSSERDIWIAVEATVEENAVNLGPGGQDPSSQPHIPHWERQHNEDVLSSRRSYNYGRITSLRLCYKATDKCIVREIVGQKRMKNVSMGQKCSLFVKVHVPELSVQSTNDNGSDQDSLFAELESLVGTLEVDILHIEARYRLSVLPADNVVAIRRVCRVRRPDWSSRWSNAQELCTQMDDPSTVYRGLAEHLASRFSPSRTIELLHQYIGPTYSDGRDIFRITSEGHAVVGQDSEQVMKDEHVQPSVVITATEGAEDREAPPHDSLFGGTDIANVFHSMNLDHHVLPWTSTLLSTPKSATALAQPVIRNTLSAPSVRQNIGKPSVTPLYSDQGAEDTARQLWRSIRRTSLSTQQIDALTSPEQVARLEAEDAGIRMLRRTAIANKRSVGAETLKGWKWDEDMEGESGRDRAEAPWL